MQTVLKWYSVIMLVAFLGGGIYGTVEVARTGSTGNVAPWIMIGPMVALLAFVLLFLTIAPVIQKFTDSDR